MSKGKLEVHTVRGRPMDIYMQLVNEYHSGNGWAVKRGSLNQVILERSADQAPKQEVQDVKETPKKEVPKETQKVEPTKPTNSDDVDKTEAPVKKTTTRKTVAKK